MSKRRDFIKKSILGTTGIAIGGIGVSSNSCSSTTGQMTLIQSDLPRPVVPMTEEKLGRKPLNLYGSLEEPMQKIRSYRPLDLNAQTWKKANPGRSQKEWAMQAKECLMNGLHYYLPPVDLKAETLERDETDTFVREKIEFNTTPWFRVPGYFYIPKNVPLPAPAVIVMHEWGGPMLFGADRVCGKPVHPVIVKHRDSTTSGRPLADWYASRGYAVSDSYSWMDDFRRHTASV